MRGCPWTPSCSACTRRRSHPWEAACGPREPRGLASNSFIAEAVAPSRGRRSQDRRRMEQEQCISCHRHSKHRHGSADSRQMLVVSAFSARNIRPALPRAGLTARAESDDMRRLDREYFGGGSAKVPHSSAFGYRTSQLSYGSIRVHSGGELVCGTTQAFLYKTYIYQRQALPPCLSRLESIVRRSWLTGRGPTGGQAGWVADRSQRTPLNQPCRSSNVQYSRLLLFLYVVHVCV